MTPYYSIIFLLQWNPFWEAAPSGKATWRCKSKHKCTDFYPWQEATPLERPLFWCKRGGLTRGVPLYMHISLNYKTEYKLWFFSYKIQNFYTSQPCILFTFLLKACVFCVQIWPENRQWLVQRHVEFDITSRKAYAVTVCTIIYMVIGMTWLVSEPMTYRIRSKLTN